MSYYSYFNVKSKSDGYKLEIVASNSTSSLLDWSNYHNGHNFSSFDNDQDENVSLNCVSQWQGGWWFNNCFGVCPTCSRGSYFDSNNILFVFNYVKILVK